MKKDNTKSVKISGSLYDKLASLSKKDHRFINYHLNKALTNYLISKKEI